MLSLQRFVKGRPICFRNSEIDITNANVLLCLFLVAYEYIYMTIPIVIHQFDYLEAVNYYSKFDKEFILSHRIHKASCIWKMEGSCSAFTSLSVTLCSVPPRGFGITKR